MIVSMKVQKFLKLRKKMWGWRLASTIDNR